MIRALVPRGLTLLVAVVAALALPAGARAAGPPQPVPLSAGWQYAPDGNDQGLKLGWQAGRGRPPWQSISIPHVFDGRPDPATFLGTVGWYRITFVGPQTQRGMSWALHFGQVRRVARVWLNGRPIGTSDTPYTPFELPASGLRPGKPNTLLMRVDNIRSPQLREGWWNWGGITQPVSLVPRGPVVLHDVGVLPRRSCDSARCPWTVLVDGELQNAGATARTPSIALSMRAPDGTITRGRTSVRTMRPGERLRVRFIVPVAGDAAPWSPDKPQLYDTTVSTSVGGRVVQRDDDRIGLRIVRVVDGTLLLNGRPLNMRGASIQEDVPGRGAALTDADLDDIVAELKALGANVTRAHYLLDERLLRRFDEAGILVWNQAPVYHRDAQLRTPAQRSYELGVLRRTVLGARNHPSVVTDSTANELTAQPDKHPSSRTWMLNAAAVARDLNPSVPVSIDILSYPGIPQQRTYDAYDMLGINAYYGWYAGKPNRSTAKLSELAPYLRAMHARYPQTGLVMTEFGAEADRSGPADVKQTYAFQTNYLKRNLQIVDGLPFMNGAIYWTTREFAVKPNWNGGADPTSHDAIHKKGLIAYDGKVKPAFAAAQAAFKAAPLYRRNPVAVARAQLQRPRSVILSGLLVIVVIGLIGLVLWLDARWLGDIWRALRPREAEIVELRREAA